MILDGPEHCINIAIPSLSHSSSSSFPIHLHVRSSYRFAWLCATPQSALATYIGCSAAKIHFQIRPRQPCFSRRPIFSPLLLSIFCLTLHCSAILLAFQLTSTVWSISQKRTLWTQTNRINASRSWLGIFLALPFSRCIACCWTLGWSIYLIQPKFNGSHRLNWVWRSSTLAICMPSNVRLHTVPFGRIVIRQVPGLIWWSFQPATRRGELGKSRWHGLDLLKTNKTAWFWAFEVTNGYLIVMVHYTCSQ